MSNLLAKPFWKSTVFQVTVLMYVIPNVFMYFTHQINAATALDNLKWAVIFYVSKEMVAKGAEAFRDKQ